MLKKWPKNPEKRSSLSLSLSLLQETPMSERWREDAPWEGVGERAACATCDSFVVSPLLLLLSVRKGMTMTKVVVIVAEPILNEKWCGI